MAFPLYLIRDRARGFKALLGVTYRFRGELYPHWRPLLVAFLSSIAYTAGRLAEPWPLKFIFDNVLTEKPLRTPFAWVNRTLDGERMLILIIATVALLVLALLRGIFYYHQTVLTSQVGQDVVLRLRQKLFSHLQRLSLSFHTRSSTGDLLTRLMSDIALLRDLLVASLLSFMSEGFILVGVVVVMFAMEWRLALLAMLVLPALLLLLTVYSGRLREATRKQRRREGRLASRLHEVLAGIHVVQMFAREDQEDERLRLLNRSSFKSGLKASRIEAQLNRSVELALAVATSAMLWLGATLVISGRLTPGELIVFVSYMQSFYRPLRRISRIAERSSKASSSLERITDVLERESDVRDGSRVAPRFRGEVRFEAVDFAYSPDVPVLRDINLVLEPGQVVAVVGRTGSGKSTLLSLIPRLYDPQSGVVRIDGQDIREFTLKSLRDQISVVPQHSLLFGGDFRENLVYGKSDATDAEIEAAARAAQIHEFIASLPAGYASPVGERGVTLSGGQAQRLAIARALVKDARIILLDEPTAALDARSEKLLLAALGRLFEGRTAIIVAHRLSTIRRADLIVVLEGGRIVEQGRHEELLQLGGRYRAFHDLQFRATGSERPERISIGA